MKVGLAFDLRATYIALGLSEEQSAEFDSPGTIEALEGALRGLGHEVERIGNIFDLVRALQQGTQWDLVFNLSEGLLGRSREAQVPALLEAYGIPYTFSDPVTLGVCLDKALTKRLVRDAGVPTPWYFLISSVADIEQHVLRAERLPVFLKPVAEGTGKGVTPGSVAHSNEELRAQALRLLDAYRQPVIVEPFLPGREFTVGIVGNGSSARALGVLEVVLKDKAEQGVYSYINKEKCEELVSYPLVTDEAIVEEATKVALAAYHALEVRDAGRVDLRADRWGKLQFIEMNPVAGLHPTHSDLPMLATAVGMSYQELIGAIVQSASEREHRPLPFARPV